MAESIWLDDLFQVGFFLPFGEEEGERGKYKILTWLISAVFFHKTLQIGSIWDFIQSKRFKVQIQSLKDRITTQSYSTTIWYSLQ